MQERAAKALSEEPQISLEIDSEIGNKEEGTYGANAPTQAEITQLEKVVSQKISDTDSHLKAVHAENANETPYHIAGAAIGNEGRENEPDPSVSARHPVGYRGIHGAAVEDSTKDAGRDGRQSLQQIDEEDTAKMPAVRLQAVAAGQAPIVTSLPIDNDPSRQSTVSHTPGTPSRPLAAGTADVTSRHGDAGSDQAPRSLLPSEPAQADFPPAGSAASGTTTAQASGDHVTGASNPTIHKPHTVPKRPATSAPILSPEEQTVIDRWFIAMNKRYPLTDSLIKAAKLLAPCNPSVEDLKTVRGFCFTSNPEWFRDKRKGAVTLLDIAKNWEGWQSSQEKPEEPAQLPKIDEPERGVSGLPKFKTTRKYNYDD